MAKGISTTTPANQPGEPAMDASPAAPRVSADPATLEGWRIRCTSPQPRSEGEELFWSNAQGWVDVGYDVWIGERHGRGLPTDAVWEPFDASSLSADHSLARQDFYREAGTLPAPHDLPIKVSFVPQAWVNDSAIECDHQGGNEWIVFPDEVGPEANLSRDEGRDFLKDSRWAPAWVRDWSGPFEVRLEGVPHMDDPALWRDSRLQDEWEARSPSTDIEGQDGGRADDACFEAAPQAPLEQGDGDDPSIGLHPVLVDASAVGVPFKVPVEMEVFDNGGGDLWTYEDGQSRDLERHESGSIVWRVMP